MGNIASAETVLKNAVKRTYGTVRKREQKAKVFKAWTVSQLLETYKDPRAILLEIASMDTRKLAADAKCTYMEALQERRLAATVVLPYISQRLPVQVDMRHTKAIHLNIVDERAMQELVTLASDDDGQSMQLITAPIADEQITLEHDAQQQGETDVSPNVAAQPTGERESD